MAFSKWEFLFSIWGCT